ncbi:hypothetical protein [Aerosakkonema funiforme]|uniref:hypothetical protein n=1 Tax=Aerosakkonema funiforme TaxID=1246630 RepID=UPI0035B8D21F
MKSLKSGLIVLSSVGLLFLGACSNNGTTTSNQTSSPAASQPESSNSATSTSTTAKTEHPSESKGGQVVESGPYHLELVPEKEANGTHLDFYLQRGDNHEAIPNAKVAAQIQLPDGTQKTLDLKYDADGKHYTVLLPGTTPGQYQVKMTADINGEKVNGRFNFNK